jgi:shikimate kinase
VKIVLLGYMGSGKSSIGKVLSKNLSMRFIDLDDYIIEKEKLSIREIFKEKGEIYFRRIEHKYLKDIVSKKDDFILSLGGGTPCYANNMEEINKTDAISIYLQASLSTLVQRLLMNKSERPLIASLSSDQIPEFIAKHLFERRYFYEQAKFTLKIDDKSMKELTNEIANLLS